MKKWIGIIILCIFVLWVGTSYGALSSEVYKTIFSCDGSTTAFNFLFKVFDEDDLSVIYIDASNVETTLTITTDYSVSDLSDTGGKVTTVATYAAGTKLVVKRNQPLTQDIEYTQYGAFSTDVLEQQLDEIVMMVQKQQEQIDRTLLQAVTATSSITFPTASAEKYIGWNVAGDGLTNYDAEIIDTNNIANGSIVAAKLASDAVETAKIKDANVTTAKIKDANVTAAKLASDAVETDKIKDANVTSAKLVASGDYGLFTGDWSFNEIALSEDTAPSTAASEGKIYTKDTSGQPELFFREESDGDEVQITNAGTVGKSVGSYSSKSEDTAYEATTDGFVIAYSSRDAEAYLIGYSDGSNPPTTVVAKSHTNRTGGSVAFIMFPVKKGNYWKVVEQTSGAVNVVSWVSLD